MGWLWSNSGSSSDDPLNNLNPELREFLAKESPVKYNSSGSAAPPQPSSTSDARSEYRAATAQQPSERQDVNEPQIPSQSLFPDGRYAKLWATYQSLSEIEAAFKSDSEKVNDILEGYRHRKAEISRAALENCALEQWALNECFTSGGWAERMQMCRKENRKLERCYTMQAKFLKALGYLSTYDRPPEVEERIQMHADTLYHRMLEQEEAIEAAKAEGRPIPVFPPLVSKANPRLSPSAQEHLKKHLDGLGDEDREIEEQSIKADIKAAGTVMGQLGSIKEKQEEERRRRKQEGRETIGDRLFSFFRFRS